MSDVVVQQAARHLKLMSQLTPAELFYFRSYTCEGARGLVELCDAAETLATASDSDSALASLIIAPGDSDAFVLNGAHARATLSVCHTPHTRLYVIVAMLIAILLALVCLRSSH